MTDQELVNALDHLKAKCHLASVNAGWYAGGHANVGEKIALAHSELSEALEGYRKDLMDKHLPHRPMVEVELADALIRILDLAGYLYADIGAALLEKLEYNKHRADHKPEARAGKNGKKF